MTPRYAAAIDGIIPQPSPTPRTTRIAELTVYGVWAVRPVASTDSPRAIGRYSGIRISEPNSAAPTSRTSTPAAAKLGSRNRVRSISGRPGHAQRVHHERTVSVNCQRSIDFPRSLVLLPPVALRTGLGRGTALASERGDHRQADREEETFGERDAFEDGQRWPCHDASSTDRRR